MHLACSVSIEALLSHGDGSDEPVDLTRWKPRRPAKDELLWINVEAPDADELGVIRKAVDLGDAAYEAIKAELDGPRANVLAGATFVVVGFMVVMAAVTLIPARWRGWL